MHCYLTLCTSKLIQRSHQAAMFEYTCTPASKKQGKVKGNKRMGSTE